MVRTPGKRKNRINYRSMTFLKESSNLKKMVSELANAI